MSAKHQCTSATLDTTLERPRWAKQHADQFTQFYYNTFDQDRKNLAALYVRVPPRISRLRFTDLVPEIARQIYAHVRNSSDTRLSCYYRKARGMEHASNAARCHSNVNPSPYHSKRLPTSCLPLMHSPQMRPEEYWSWSPGNCS